MCKYVGNKKVQNGYATWDPRKNKTGEVPQYDEIPYGDVGPPGVGPQAQAQGFVDGHSGKGQLPQVPAEYSQVPNIPQRQGIHFIPGLRILDNLWINNPEIGHFSYNADCHNIGQQRLILLMVVLVKKCLFCSAILGFQP